MAKRPYIRRIKDTTSLPNKEEYRLEQHKLYVETISPSGKPGTSSPTVPLSEALKIKGLAASLPTSDPGIPEALWNDGGSIKVSAASGGGGGTPPPPVVIPPKFTISLNSLNPTGVTPTASGAGPATAGTFSLVGETQDGPGGAAVPFAMPPIAFNAGDPLTTAFDKNAVAAAWNNNQQDANGVDIGVASFPIGEAVLVTVVTGAPGNANIQFVPGSLKIVWT